MKLNLAMIAKLRDRLRRLPTPPEMSAWPPEFSSRLQDAYYGSHQGVLFATGGDNRLAIIAAGMWTDRYLADLETDPNATRPDIANGSEEFPYPSVADGDEEGEISMDVTRVLEPEEEAALAALIVEARAVVLGAEDEEWIARTTREARENQPRSPTAPHKPPL